MIEEDEEFSHLRRYQTVATWLASLPTVPSVQARHLKVLQRFCVAEWSDPDALIAAGQESRDAKNTTMRRLRRWAEAETSSDRERHDLENVVRSFFISNGLRVLTKPYPDVYRRPAASANGHEADR